MSLSSHKFGADALNLVVRFMHVLLPKPSIENVQVGARREGTNSTSRELREESNSQSGDF